MYYDYKSFIKCVICRYFLLVSGLSLPSLNSMFGRAEVLNFDKVQTNILLWIVLLDMVSKKSLSNPHSQRFLPIFLPKCCIV